MSAELLKKLIEAGTPAELVAEVAMLAAEVTALERRRKSDRDRQANYRHVTSRDSRDTLRQDVTPREVPPQTPLPNSPDYAPLNPPKTRRAGKHLLPDDWKLPPIAELTPKARECAEQWPKGTYEREGEAFECYWRSAKRMMADWRLTWANRVIDQHGKVMREQPLRSDGPSFLRQYQDEMARKRSATA